MGLSSLYCSGGEASSGGFTFLASPGAQIDDDQNRAGIGYEDMNVERKIVFIQSENELIKAFSRFGNFMYLKIREAAMMGIDGHRLHVRLRVLYDNPEKVVENWMALDALTRYSRCVYYSKAIQHLKFRWDADLDKRVQAVYGYQHLANVVLPPHDVVNSLLDCMHESALYYHSIHEHLGVDGVIGYYMLRWLFYKLVFRVRCWKYMVPRYRLPYGVHVEDPISPIRDTDGCCIGSTTSQKLEEAIKQTGVIPEDAFLPPNTGQRHVIDELAKAWCDEKIDLAPNSSEHVLLPSHSPNTECVCADDPDGAYSAEQVCTESKRTGSPPSPGRGDCGGPSEIS